MKFGISIPGLTRMPASLEPWHAAVAQRDILRVAQRADELGYHHLSVPEHVIMVEERMGYLGPRWPDAISTLAFLAGATRRIRLVNSVLVLPYHNPVICAKAFATIDYLSSGRTILGVGVGHLEREFAILNVPFRERGPMTDEYLRAIKELWTSDRPAFQGRFVQFDRVAFEPKPVQRPHPPIWVGGNSRAAIRRAAELGDGWVPFRLTREQIAAGMEYLRQQPGFQKRTRPFDVGLPVRPYRLDEPGYRLGADPTRPTTRDAIVELVGQARDLGATVFNAAFPKQPGSVDEYLEQMQWFAEEVMPAFGG